jgi:O-antigen/teichoic acid export membrane protein
LKSRLPVVLHQSLKAGGVRLAVYPLTAAAGLLTTHLVVSYTGLTVFGYVSLIGTLVTLVPFADFGIGAAIMNAAATDRSDPREELVATLVAGLRVLAVSGVTVILISVALGIAEAWGPLLGSSTARLPFLQSAASAVFILFAVALPLGVGQRLLVGLALTHEAVLFSAVAPLVTLAVTAVFVTSGVPSAFLALPLGVGGLVAAALSFVRGFRAARISLSPVLASAWHWRSVKGVPVRHTAWPMFIILVAQPLALNSDRLVLSHFGTAMQLAGYSLFYQVYLPAWAVLSSAAFSLWNVFKSHEAEDKRTSWRVATSAFGLAGLVGGLLLVFPGVDLAHVVAGHRHDGVTASLALSFGAFLLVQSLIMPSGMLLTTPRQLWFQAECVTAMLLVNLPLSIWLTIDLGTIGPVLASAIALFLTQLIPYQLKVRRELARAEGASLSAALAPETVPAREF